MPCSLPLQSAHATAIGTVVRLFRQQKSTTNSLLYVRPPDSVPVSPNRRERFAESRHVTSCGEQISTGLRGELVSARAEHVRYLTYVRYVRHPGYLAPSSSHGGVPEFGRRVSSVSQFHQLTRKLLSSACVPARALIDRRLSCPGALRDRAQIHNGTVRQTTRVVQTLACHTRKEERKVRRYHTYVRYVHARTSSPGSPVEICSRNITWQLSVTISRRLGKTRSRMLAEGC